MGQESNPTSNNPLSLYVHLESSNPLDDFHPISNWLTENYKASRMLSTSFMIDCAYLAVENPAEEFVVDFTNFLGHQYAGLRFAICLTPEVQCGSYVFDPDLHQE